MNSYFESYDKLEKYPSNINYVSLLREVSNGATTLGDTNKLISTITELRRMRKYHKELFEKTFDNIISRFITVYFKSSNDNTHNNHVLLAGISFVNELFSEFQFEFDESWIEKLYFAIEQFFCSKDNIIKQLSREAANNLSINMHFTTTFTVFIESLDDCNEELAKFIYDLFILCFNNIDNTNLMFRYDWNEIIKNISINDDHNSSQFICLKHVFIALKNKLKDNWDEFFMGIYTENKEIINLFFN